MTDPYKELKAKGQPRKAGHGKVSKETWERADRALELANTVIASYEAHKAAKSAEAAKEATAKAAAKEATDLKLVAVQAARDAAEWHRGKAGELKEKLANVNDTGLQSYYRARMAEHNRKAKESDAEASKLLAEHIERMSSPVDLRPGESVEDAKNRLKREADFKRTYGEI